MRMRTTTMMMRKKTSTTRRTLTHLAHPNVNVSNKGTLHHHNHINASSNHNHSNQPDTILHPVDPSLRLVN
jgi:hypothetical protein